MPETKAWRVRPQTALLLLIVAALCGGAVGSLATARKAGVTVPLFLAASSQAAGSPPSASGYTELVKKAAPAVASVFSSRVVKAPSADEIPPFLRQFFGDRNLPPRREEGLGSAVIVSPDGYLLTNNHVVEGADQVTISLADGREVKAKIVGTDPKTDIAVLKIDEKNLPVLPLADSDQVQVGEFVLAIGNPFGVGQTVTFGIVSATGRAGIDPEHYEDFIQTDAAINPGNSGGALINVSGQLIGINSAIIGPSGGNVGIGFAVPSNMARMVMEQILQHGKVIRGYLGVLIQPVTEKEAKAFSLPGQPRGALVGDVTAGSAAEKAGVKRGDIILELNGQPVPDARELRLKVAALQPGATARLKIFREGKESELSVKLGEAPTETAEARPAAGREPAGLAGLNVQDLTPQIARQLGLPSTTRGVVVADVEPGSPAAEAGLRQGDVIEQVNRRPVTNVAEYESAVRQGAGQPVLLLVNRGGSTSFVVVEPR